MESATTDVCEWCKRPMLPAGATVTGQAPTSSTPEPEAEEAEQEPEPRQEEETQQAEEPAEASVELRQLGGNTGEAAAAAAAQAGGDDILRPLGSPNTTAPAPGMPSGPDYRVGEDQTRTSVDVSEYVGADQSIFRPMARPQGAASMPGGADPLARRRKREAQEEAREDKASENVRLLRSLGAGLLICVGVAVLEITLQKEVPHRLYFLQLGRPEEMLTALKFGLLTGLLLGGGLGAIAVRFKLGWFVGMMMGLAVGIGLRNGWYGYLAGAVTGIFAGALATKGVRRVVNV
jgi:hypothetical protein